MRTVIGAVVLMMVVGEPEAMDRWSVVEMQGRRAGYVRETVRVEGAAGARRIVSRNQTRLTIKRGQGVVEIETVAEFVETLEHRPVSMWSLSRTGARPVEQRYTFGEAGVEVATTQGEPGAEPTKRREALPEGAWLTPGAAQEMMRRAISEGRTEVECRMLEPQDGLKPVTTTRRLIERGECDVLGRTVPALKWDVTSDSQPGQHVVEFTDEAGREVRSETRIGDVEVLTVLADGDLAGAELDPPELLLSTMVRPDRLIQRARATTSASYTIICKGEDCALQDLPSGGMQRVERIDARTIRVMVESGRTSEATEEERASDALRRCTVMLSCDDARVKEMARGVAGKGRGEGDAAKAEAMRRLVHGYISTKDLSVGFASAAEVAATRTGDCTEHAVLLAALLRAGGIRSRVVSGLIYTEEFQGKRSVFGYHMWAQALIERGEAGEEGGAARWIDLDATLGERATDATHIALAYSAMEDGQAGNALVKLAPLIGTIDVRVDRVR